LNIVLQIIANIVIKILSGGIYTRANCGSVDGGKPKSICPTQRGHDCVRKRFDGDHYLGRLESRLLVARICECLSTDGTRMQSVC
jgi:hypothetical protein